MKKLTTAIFALTVIGGLLAATAADAQRHHRHKVCSWRHHHRICRWI